jgi:hypothetical protein
VFDHPYFKDASFPGNMADIWRAQWAFVENATGRYDPHNTYPCVWKEEQIIYLDGQEERIK